jgi:hypothetical protein
MLDDDQPVAMLTGEGIVLYGAAFGEGLEIPSWP